MEKHCLQLPKIKEDCINELFSYGLEIFPDKTGLKPGYWIEIIFEWSQPNSAFKSGGISKLRYLFIEGMNVLAERIKGTAVLGVYGETDVHSILLKRLGFTVIDGRNDLDNYAFGRYAYMTLDYFLEKPWLAA